MVLNGYDVCDGGLIVMILDGWFFILLRQSILTSGNSRQKRPPTSKQISSIAMCALEAQRIGGEHLGYGVSYDGAVSTLVRIMFILGYVYDFGDEIFLRGMIVMPETKIHIGICGGYGLVV